MSDIERMTWGPETPVRHAATLDEARRLAQPADEPDETESDES